MAGCQLVGALKRFTRPLEIVLAYGREAGEVMTELEVRRSLLQRSGIFGRSFPVFQGHARKPSLGAVLQRATAVFHGLRVSGLSPSVITRGA